MHQYLYAIGFEKSTARRDLNRLLKDAEKNFTHRSITLFREDAEKFCEYRKVCGDMVGIRVCGEIGEDGKFERAYYFPYFVGSGITTYAEILFERKMEKEQYLCTCDDMKVGISLIFTLQNVSDYLRMKRLGTGESITTSVTLSGLALSGTILLPVRKEGRLQQEMQKDKESRTLLMQKALEGDQTAIETLTLDEMDTYTKVNRRLQNEDVFTIVNTYFMPCGAQCDRYSILGEILHVRESKNKVTGENLCQMRLDVNDLQFDVCVPRAALEGEPEAGRRFKGVIWLQGRVNF